MPEGFIPPHGGYRKLFAYQRAETVYDATVRFCERFLDRRDRTVDQMIQAARSGKQNIIEGSMASGTSKETEIKLTNVARASLEELLADYQDFLRNKRLPFWTKDDPRTREVRALARGPNVSYGAYAAYVERGTPEESANTVICLIHQANYLLDQHIRRLEKAFVEEGGLRERMTRARLTERARQWGRGPRSEERGDDRKMFSGMCHSDARRQAHRNAARPLRFDTRCHDLIIPHGQKDTACSSVARRRCGRRRQCRQS